MHRVKVSTRVVALALATVAFVGVAAFFSSGSLRPAPAESTGPFEVDGLAEASFTASFPNPLPTSHSHCLFRMETIGSTANMRAMCYNPIKFPPTTTLLPPPPPPPYSPVGPSPTGLQVLSGAITGSATTTLSTKVTAGQTVPFTMDVGSTATFPASGVIVVDSERFAYDSKTGTTLNIVRRAIDSTAAQHAVSATVDASGSITFTFAPDLCLPVDNNPDDGTVDGGISVNLLASATKTGDIESGAVILKVDRTPIGGPFTCDDFNPAETIVGEFSPTMLDAATHNADTTSPFTSLTAKVTDAATPPFNLLVVSTSGFPSSGSISVGGEQMTYTSITATTISVSARAQNGTTAAQHEINAPVVSLDIVSVVPDGCTSYVELGPTASAGGLRDPWNPYDHYDINHDGAIAIGADILTVAGAFGGSGGPNYIAEKDRGSTIGPFSWNKNGPDGSIAIGADILGVAGQFGHGCPHSDHSQPTAFGGHPTTLTAKVASAQTVPFAMDVATTATFAKSGQLLINSETFTYDQNAGTCGGGFTPATQFCITARGGAGQHMAATTVFDKP